jgi:hypothetical protein
MRTVALVVIRNGDDLKVFRIQTAHWSDPLKLDWVQTSEQPTEFLYQSGSPLPYRIMELFLLKVVRVGYERASRHSALGGAFTAPFLAGLSASRRILCDASRTGREGTISGASTYGSPRRRMVAYSSLEALSLSTITSGFDPGLCFSIRCSSAIAWSSRSICSCK